MKNIVATIVVLLVLVGIFYAAGTPPPKWLYVVLGLCVPGVIVWEYRNRSTVTGSAKAAGDGSPAVSGIGNTLHIHNHFHDIARDKYDAVMRKNRAESKENDEGTKEDTLGPKLTLDSDEIKPEDKEKLARMYDGVFRRTNKQIKRLLQTGDKDDAMDACTIWMTQTVYLNYHRETIILLKRETVEQHFQMMMEVKALLIQHPHARAFTESLGVDWDWNPSGVK